MFIFSNDSLFPPQFFKLSEMERFLESEDAAEERRRLREEKGLEAAEDSDDDDDEDIDYFGVGDERDDVGGEEDDEREGRARYSDYFGGERTCDITDMK